MYMNIDLIKEYNLISNELKNLTRIERLARRLPIQIEFINRALDEVREINGDVWELGLGEGRTLEYMESKTKSPITVFEIDEKAVLDNNKKTTKLVIGDIFKTIPGISKDQSTPVKMVHADIGTTNYSDDISRVASLSDLLAPIVASNGVILCDRPIVFTSFELLLHAHDVGWPYYLWKKKNES
jgi:hypothetical protein